MKFFVYGCFSLLLLSCSSDQRVARYVRHQIGQSVIINLNHYRDDASLLDSLFDNSLLTITTTIRKSSCVSCYYSKLNELSALIDSCYSDSINCIVFVHENYEHYMELQEMYKLPHIYIVNDDEDYYTRDNRLGKYNVDYRTFMVNASKKIVLVGNPMFNSNVRQLYAKEIKRHLNELD